MANSSYTIIYSPRSHTEMEEALTWYREREPELGQRLLDEVNSRVESIRTNPEQCAIRVGHYRDAIVRSFPYNIIYRINKRKRMITVHSIYHTAKDPKNKYKK